MLEPQELEAGAPMQSLMQDEAYLLASRGVVSLRGDVEAAGLTRVLQPLVCSNLENVEKKAVLAYVLDKAGAIRIDLFVVPNEGGLLLELPRSLVADMLDALEGPAAKRGIEVQDVSDQWRVLAETPDMTTFDDGSPFIKYSDPRWHMGARVMRAASLPQSYNWGNELRWVGHALKLGFLPGADLLRNAGGSNRVSVAEAGLHCMGLVDLKRMPVSLQTVLADPRQRLQRRLLPVRLEPNGFNFPDMAGQPVVAGDARIGTVLVHQGLYGLVLVELAPWRAAQATGQRLCCCGQQVLITWPSWLAQESLGRGGPVALADN